MRTETVMYTCDKCKKNMGSKENYHLELVWSENAPRYEKPGYNNTAQSGIDLCWDCSRNILSSVGLKRDF